MALAYAKRAKKLVRQLQGEVKLSDLYVWSGALSGYEASLTAEIIISSFRKCGLWPLHPVTLCDNVYLSLQRSPAI